MDIGWAIQHIKKPKESGVETSLSSTRSYARRKRWKDKGIFLSYSDGYKSEDRWFDCTPAIYVNNPEFGQTMWIPRQRDLLADDYEEANPGI